MGDVTKQFRLGNRLIRGTSSKVLVEIQSYNLLSVDNKVGYNSYLKQVLWEEMFYSNMDHPIARKI